MGYGSGDEQGPEIVRLRKFREEGSHADHWYKHKKHIFVLTDAGKPVFARYGDEDRLSGFFGILQALVSFVGAQDDKLQYIVAGKHKFVWLLRPPLYCVAVTRTGEPILHIWKQLEYVYDHFVSILTRRFFEKFKTRANLDLRRWLQGTENVLATLIKNANIEPAFYLGSVRSLKISQTLRNTISNIVLQARVPNLIYAVIGTDRHDLVTLARRKGRKWALDARDLHLVFNFVCSCSSVAGSEGAWNQFCLPRLSADRVLYIYSSWLSPHLFLLLFAPKEDHLFDMADCGKRIVEQISNSEIMSELVAASESGNFNMRQADVPEIRHFLYKSLPISQFISPNYSYPYSRKKQRERLSRLYQNLTALVLRHRPDGRPRILWHVGEFESAIGWVSKSFVLYAVMDPLIGKRRAVMACNRLIRWIKKEEQSLFILNAPVW